MAFRKLLYDNYITPTRSGKNYRCYACDKLVYFGNAKKHVLLYSHQNFLRILKIKELQICTKTSSIFINVQYCRQCQVCLVNDEIYKYHCLMHFYKTNKDYIIDADIINFNFQQKGKILINCLLCDKELNDEQMLAVHLKSSSHKKRLNLISQITIPEILMNFEWNSNLIDSSKCNNKCDIIIVQYCILCEQRILESNVFDHVNRKDHSQLLNLDVESKDETKINLLDLYTCFLCNKSYSNQILFLNHFDSKEHVYISANVHEILENKHIIIKTLQQKAAIYCKICCKDLPSIISTVEHIETLNHTLKVNNIEKNINKVQNVSTSVAIPACASQNYIQNLNLNHKPDTTSISFCDDVDNLLNELVPFDKSSVHDLKNRSIKDKNKGEKRKPHLQKHFDKNLCKFANVYIEMCIESGVKNIYNIQLESKAALNISNLVKSLWYYAQVFLCSICHKRKSLKFDFELDFIIHLLSANHIKKLSKLKLKNKETKFHICPICVTYWYGEADEFSIHCGEISHKHCLYSNEFVVPDLSRIVIDMLKTVDKNVKYLLSESDKTYNDEQDRELQLLQSIENIAQAAYPQAKAYIFGSRLSYLGSPDSDVDIFLDCENVYHNKFHENKQSAIYLETIKDLLVLQQDNWIIEEILLRTRVPILKLISVDTNLKCDISFVNGLGVEKSKLIRQFNEAYPMCRQLILYLKKWLKNCRLLGASRITTYALSWFVIYYLQTENILPSVHSLLDSKNIKLVDGWNCNFTEKIPITTKNLTLKNLLNKFFLLYATFDYQSNVVCPLLGKLVKKSSFTKSSELPEEMYMYKNQLDSGEIEFFRLDSPMCIQDPVDQSQNMTKAVPKHLLRYFIEYCTVSAEYVKTCT